jgi:hypothetical protein
MSEHEMEPLDSGLDELFAAERGHAAQPTAAARARLRGRVAASVGVAVGAGAAAALAPGHAAASAAAGSVAPGAVANSALVATGKLALVLAFAGGAAVGAGVHAGAARFTAPEAPVAVAAPLVPRVTLDVRVRDAVPPLVDSAAAPRARAARPRAQAMAANAAGASDTIAREPDAPGDRDLDLAADREALDVARVAELRGNHAAALEALEDHARRFPRSRLGQEREVLWIQALAGAGRRSEAAARATDFERRHPDSLLTSAVRAAVGQSP